MAITGVYTQSGVGECSDEESLIHCDKHSQS
jgi:hypothetical protein